MGQQPTRTPVSMPAGRALVVILVCLITWTFLYAPTMKRQAEASPEGLRRTLSIAAHYLDLAQRYAKGMFPPPWEQPPRGGTA